MNINEVHTFGYQTSAYNYLNDKVESIQNRKARIITRVAVLILKTCTLPITLTIDISLGISQGIIALSKGLGARRASHICFTKIKNGFKASMPSLSMLGIAIIVYAFVKILGFNTTSPIIQATINKGIQLGLPSVLAFIGTLVIYETIGVTSILGLGFCITHIFKTIFGEGNRRDFLLGSVPDHRVTLQFDLTNYSIGGNSFTPQEVVTLQRTLNDEINNGTETEELKAFYLDATVVQAKYDEMTKLKSAEDKRSENPSLLRRVCSLSALGYTRESTLPSNNEFLSNSLALSKFLLREKILPMKDAVRHDIMFKHTRFWLDVDRCHKLMEANPPTDPNPMDPYQRMRKLVWDGVCSPQELLEAKGNLDLCALFNNPQYPEAEYFDRLIQCVPVPVAPPAPPRKPVHRTQHYAGQAACSSQG